MGTGPLFQSEETLSQASMGPIPTPSVNLSGPYKTDLGEQS